MRDQGRLLGLLSPYLPNITLIELDLSIVVADISIIINLLTFSYSNECNGFAFI